ncbi:MAG: efflux RND transporter periplasmic adaptor subunit [Ignavibacteria bacterium]|nr:efflux RND transporter periplasmic adaptor subunit [Ignavibacteria bacterium]
MKSLKILAAIAAVVVLFAAIKFFFITSGSAGKGAKGPGKPGAMMPTAVNVFVAASQEMTNDVYTTGSIIANEEVVLMPEISGKVVKLNINEGGAVKRGQLLVKINDSDFQAQLKKLELQAAITKEKIDRLKQLLAVSGASQEEYDVMVNLARTVDTDIEFVRSQIAKTEIRAPFDGVVGLKYISTGSFVTNTTRIATVQQLDKVKIDFSVPERYFNVMRKNSVIDFTLSDNSTVFHARVYAIEPKIDPTTRTIQLRALAVNHGMLYPGAFVKVVLPLRDISDAIMIPTQAIIPILKGKKVFLYKGGKAREAEVETGIRTDESIQIISGISPGDSVITTGFVQLINDSPVRVIR